jgi:hypothetical protein
MNSIFIVLNSPSEHTIFSFNYLFMIILNYKSSIVDDQKTVGGEGLGVDGGGGGVFRTRKKEKPNSH